MKQAGEGAPPRLRRFKMSKPKDFQTTFGYGRDHFSQSHANHGLGSTAPVQRDFGLNMPNGRFRPLVGVDSPSGLSIQTTLKQFKR